MKPRTILRAASLTLALLVATGGSLSAQEWRPSGVRALLVRDSTTAPVAPPAAAPESHRNEWVGAAIGGLVGGMLSNAAHCAITENDECEISLKAMAPGLLLGAILGAGVGSAIPEDPDPEATPEAEARDTYLDGTAMGMAVGLLGGAILALSGSEEGGAAIGWGAAMGMIGGAVIGGVVDALHTDEAPTRPEPQSPDTVSSRYQRQNSTAIPTHSTTAPPSFISNPAACWSARRVIPSIGGASS
ncbi:MAG: hypothetical protein KY397_04065 [Gemmatimonadetes bacterium]|nr:hypothetical protein [Gemmatimonadota bacterium]